MSILKSIKNLFNKKEETISNVYIVEATYKSRKREIKGVFSTNENAEYYKNELATTIAKDDNTKIKSLIITEYQVQ